MFGERAFKLVRDFHKSQEIMPPYDRYELKEFKKVKQQADDSLLSSDAQGTGPATHLVCLGCHAARRGTDLGVQAVLEEMKSMEEFITNFMNTSRNLSHAESRNIIGSYLIQSTALVRNKRCLYAYVWNRMQKLRQLRWEFGSMLPADVRANLNEHEIKWFLNYSQSLTTYMKTLNHKHGLNLAQNTKPPKSLYLEVRSLDDYGKLETDDGEVVVLKKNSRHLLPWVQAEPLVRQGILEHAGSSVR